MILADTSVWIDHFRRGEPGLVEALDASRVLMHPFVIGELACGNLENRAEVLALLGNLPASRTATDPEVITFIERRSLMGRGIGYIDAHLLAATALSNDTLLWTRDRRLANAASDLYLNYTKKT